MFEDKIANLLVGLSDVELDEVTEPIFENLEPEPILEPIPKRLVRLLQEIDEFFLRAGDSLVQFQQTNSKDTNAFLHAVRLFLKGRKVRSSKLNEFSELQKSWKSINSAAGEFNNFKNALAQHSYTYLVCAKILYPAQEAQPIDLTDSEIEELKPAQLLNELLATIHPGRKLLALDLSKGYGNPDQVNVNTAFERQACNQLEIAESARGTFNHELRALSKILADMRMEILLHVLADGHRSPSFDYVIDVAKRSATTQGYDTRIVEQYGKSVVDKLFNDLAGATKGLRRRIENNFKLSVKCCEIENQICEDCRIEPSWRVLPKLMFLNNFKTAFSRLQSDEGQYLISKWYYEAIGTAYDLEESIRWASIAAFRGFSPAKKMMGMLQVVAGNREFAKSIYLWLKKEIEDLEVDYMLSSLLSNSQSNYEREFGERIALTSANNGHAGAMCLLARLAFLKWQYGETSQSRLALAFYEKSARLGFGRAKAELELYKLEGWTRSAQYLENADDDVHEKTLGIDATELATYTFLKSYKRGDAKSNWKLKLYEKSNETTLLTSKYLIGVLLGTSELALAVLEEAGRAGHPDACARISELYETVFNDLKKAIYWHELLLKNELIFQSTRIDPIVRMHTLKSRFYPKASSSR